MSFKDKLFNTGVKKYEGKIYLNCCVGVEYDLDLLEYFIEYYKDLEVDEFFVILNTIDKNSHKLKEGIKILDKYTNIHREIWIGDFYMTPKARKKRAIIKDYVGDNDWIITADVDEFYEFPMGLRELITICEKKNHHCVAGKYVDRLSIDGKLKKIDKKKSLWEQFPIDIQFSKQYYRHVEKIILRKNHVAISDGHHYVRSSLEKHLIFPMFLKVYHFHWIEGLINKLEDRISIWKKVNPSIDDSNHLRLLKHYDEYGTLL
jgi:hypothetical protein